MTTTAEIAHQLGISPRSTIHNGYQSEQRSLERMDEVWNWRNTHFAMRKMLLHLWFRHPRTTTSGVDAVGRPILHSPMGNGSSARSNDPTEFKRRHTTQYLPGRPTRNWDGKVWYLLPGMSPIAQPNNSVHNLNELLGDMAAACDQVGWQDHWAHANVGESQLQDFRFVNKEEWHLQDRHLGRSRSQFDRDLRAGKMLYMGPLSPIPGSVKSPDSPASPAKLPPSGTVAGTPPPMPAFQPRSVPPKLGLWPLNPDKPYLKLNQSETDEREAATLYLQAMLHALGFLPHLTDIDGIYGPATARAVTAYQKSNGLVEDGETGKQTWSSVDSKSGSFDPPKPPVVQPPGPTTLDPVKVQPNQEEEEDMLTLYRYTEYDEVFLIGGARPMNVSSALKKSYEDRGVPFIEDKHGGTLRSIIRSLEGTTYLTRSSDKKKVLIDEAFASA